MADPYTSGWWLDRLNTALDARQKPLKLYEDYYLGDQRLSFATSKFRETFGNLFHALAVNFCLLVVDAENERLKIEGFRMGAENPEADGDAWAIWTRNRMEARAPVAHAEALVKGEAYIVVWNNPERPDTPLIRVQDARKTIVEIDDGDKDERLAALKRWLDVDRHELCVLWLPDRVEKYRSRSPVAPGTTNVTSRGTDYWQRRTVPGEEWPIPNPLNVVPVIPLVNNPLLDTSGRSEIGAVIPIQDAINKLVADMIVASEYVAFPQRWATGIEVPVDPNTGQALEPFKAGPGRLWIADAVPGLDQPIEPKFGSFPQANLDPYTSAIEMLVQDIASITKTPAHYLLGQSGSFPSGESLKATETGLVAKVRSASRQFGESWEEVMRLAFRIQNDPRGDIDDNSVIWGDPESRVMSEVTDAVGKQVQMLGVPQRVAWEKVGYTQTEIERMEVIKQQERLEAALTLPAVAATPPPTNGARPAVGASPAVPTAPPGAPAPR
jgi:Phage portal protein, SPP1 Gp6-like